MPIAKIHRISATSPDDTGGIEAAIAAGRLDPKGIVAILGKTEGNGCVNDFSRGFATQSLLMMLRKFLPDEEARKVCLVMSGGTEGGMAPHWTDRKSTRLNSSHGSISYAVFCLKKKKHKEDVILLEKHARLRMQRIS